jgi:hypothetical protein
MGAAIADRRTAGGQAVNSRLWAVRKCPRSTDNSPQLGGIYFFRGLVTVALWTSDKKP